nr:EOG090X00TB [Lepidurus arcticus]
MQKFGKGLKKKKRKEKEAQFDAAVLAEYRRRQQEGADIPAASVSTPVPVSTQADQDPQTSSAVSSADSNLPPPSSVGEAENDDWKKFRLLTAGTDTLLNKTQEELGRIKKTSFYQRKPTNGSSSAKKEAEAVVSPNSATNWVDFGEGGRRRCQPRESSVVAESKQENHPTPVKETVVNEEKESPAVLQLEISDDDYENDSDDDIFSTSYVDDVTAGAIKLAYVPESPTGSPLQSPIDPFDTSIAQKYVIIEPTSAVGKAAPVPAPKKKNVLVKLDSAVKVLTGQFEGAKSPITEASTNSKTKRRVVPHRSTSDAIWFEDSADPEINVSSQNEESCTQEINAQDVFTDPFDTTEVESRTEVKSDSLSAEERAKVIAEFDLALTSVVPDKIDISVLSLSIHNHPASTVSTYPSKETGEQELDEFDEFVSLRTEDDPFIIPTNLSEQILGVNTTASASVGSADTFEANPSEENTVVLQNLATVTGINNDLFGTKAILGPSIPATPLQEGPDPFDTSITVNLDLPITLVPCCIASENDPLKTSVIVRVITREDCDFKLPETNLGEEDPFDTSIGKLDLEFNTDPVETSLVTESVVNKGSFTSESFNNSYNTAEQDPFNTFWETQQPQLAPNCEVGEDPFESFIAERVEEIRDPLFTMAVQNSAFNPFLSEAAEDDANSIFGASAANIINPFAQEPVVPTTTTSAINPFLINENVNLPPNPLASSHSNPFADFQPSHDLPNTEPAFNVFETPNQNTNVNVSIMGDVFGPSPPASANNHPIFGTTNNEITAPDNSVQNKAHMQNLILSVTGALQATSEDLLERLRAAAPSPIPSHGHSSSPSPSVNSPASCASPEPTYRAAALESHLLNQSQFDAVLDRQLELEPILDNISMEALPVSTQGIPGTEETEEIDLLGIPKPGSRSKAAILRLYQTGSNETKDLLSDEPIEPIPLVDFAGSLQQLQPESVQVTSDVPHGGRPKESEFITAMAGISFDEGLVADGSDTHLPDPVVESALPPPPEDTLFPMGTGDEFDAFALRFESARPEEMGDPFSAIQTKESSVWGTGGTGTPGEFSSGFGTSFGNDGFLTLTEPPRPPHGTPRIRNQTFSQDSDDSQPEMAIAIKPRNEETAGVSVSNFVPLLPPPPKNPFLDCHSNEPEPVLANQSVFDTFASLVESKRAQHAARTDSQETPTTPLFDDDQSLPLKPFMRFSFDQVWEMHLRQPTKKKITGQRYWKKVFIKLGRQGDTPTVQLYNGLEEKDPFYELPLQPCYSVSDISAQQFDQYGKIFTIKIQYIFYKERPGIRPGQVTKAERITNRLQQFAAYAIQGDYNGVKEFGSDLRKLGIPVEHAPQISQLLKLGSLSYEELKDFTTAVEDCLFRLPAPRDKTLSYRTEEVQMTAVDEFYVEQDKNGCVLEQLARVRLFLLAFLSGMPDVELGINELSRQGKEIVGRHDIIPVVTEEWIRLEEVELHQCVNKEEFENQKILKFKPPDACYIELMRFRIRPPKNRELALQVRTTFSDMGQRIEIRSDILVPGYMSRKYGQIPCEDVAVRIPIPEAWIYMFRVEKHFRYGSVKAAHRRAGKIKGIERLLGMSEQFDQTLFEVTSGTAKYEHQHRAIVWRVPRLPKEGQGKMSNVIARQCLTHRPQVTPDSQLELAQFLETRMPNASSSPTTSISSSRRKKFCQARILRRGAPFRAYHSSPRAVNYCAYDTHKSSHFLYCQYLSPPSTQTEH